MAEDRFMNLRPRVPWERDLGGMLGEMGGREEEGRRVRVGRERTE